MKKFISSSSAETQKFAEKLAKRIKNKELRIKNRRGALVLALTGDLGSGKTTFVQGFFRGLGIKKRVTSPTFILMRRSALPRRKSSVIGFKSVFHIDAYRIKNARELLALSFKQILENPENIVLIEWAERVKRILPERTIKISFVHKKKENERSIIFR